MRPSSMFNGTITLQSKLEAVIISLIQAGIVSVKHGSEQHYISKPTDE